MRLIFFTILSLLLTFSVSAQNRLVKKVKSVPKETSANEAAAEPANSENGELTVDTIHIPKGKPTLLLVQVTGINTAAYKDTREIQELNTNFDKSKTDIIYIKRHSFIIFENNQTLDVSKHEDSYASKVFWSGKQKEQLQTEEGLENSTEFFAKQLKVKKESSYIIDAKKHKKELAALTKKNIITDKSKEVMNALLKLYALSIKAELRELSMFNEDLKKLKEIKVYYSEKKIKKLLTLHIIFNEEGQPVNLKSYKSSGKTEADVNFIYENGMLSKINDGRQIHSVSYNNDKMIVSKKLDDGEEIKIYTLENNILLEKGYSLTNDDNLAYHNTVIEEKLENDCIIKTYNGQILKKECIAKKPNQPFLMDYISYQGEDILEKYKVKVIKKNETVYERYKADYEETENESKDNFKLTATYQLDNKKQISVIKLLENNSEKTLKIDYIYSK
ncbi:hypothetical protein [Flavobacterium sp. H122]|uniref:hypothetical protein n=1 Tax=Flavobacterium sp. H122 TaxID=2529860 RepID=UPI0010AA0143|nr:hypothetical protein [Flavobacterium sp. H122]